MPPRLPHLGIRRISSLSTSYPILYSADVVDGPSVELELLSWGRGGSGQLGSGSEQIHLYPCPVGCLRVSSSFRLSPSPGRLPDPSISTAAEAVADEVGISCGLFHSALLAGGRLLVWGKGDGGRLGLGNEDSLFAPTANPHLDGLRSVSLGGIHSTALTRTGDVITWGYGGFGALGHSGVYHRELLPRRVNGSWDGSISHLATSGAHTAAITNSGELYTWGRDEGDGRLGLGSGCGPGLAGSYSIPSKVAALPVPVSAVACGGFFTVALTSDGQLWSWGANSNYELGRGNNVSDWRPQPVSCPNDVQIVQVACGGYHSLALTDRGEVMSWGHGGHGQLGHPARQNQKVPAVIEALAAERIVYIACSCSTSAAVSDKGELYMWGNARDSQLGVPGLPDIQPLPVKINFLTDQEEQSPHLVLAVSVGASHTMCLVMKKQN